MNWSTIKSWSNAMMYVAMGSIVATIQTILYGTDRFAPLLMGQGLVLVATTLTYTIASMYAPPDDQKKHMDGSQAPTLTIRDAFPNITKVLSRLRYWQISTGTFDGSPEVRAAVWRVKEILENVTDEEWQYILPPITVVDLRGAMTALDASYPPTLTKEEWNKQHTGPLTQTIINSVRTGRQRGNTP